MSALTNDLGSRAVRLINWHRRGAGYPDLSDEEIIYRLEHGFLLPLLAFEDAKLATNRAQAEGRD